MPISIKINNPCATQYAIKFYERYKEAFGNVVSAEMKSIPSAVKYELILINDRKEEIHINGECSAGYTGEGPSGTYKILKMAGFDIDREFTTSNKSFKLTKEYNY